MAAHASLSLFNAFAPCAQRLGPPFLCPGQIRARVGSAWSDRLGARDDRRSVAGGRGSTADSHGVWPDPIGVSRFSAGLAIILLKPISTIRTTSRTCLGLLLFAHPLPKPTPLPPLIPVNGRP